MRKNKGWLIQANDLKAADFDLRGEATITAAPAEGKGPRRFKMNAYDGEPFRPHVNPPVAHPVVVDLASFDVAKQRYPALKDHDSKLLVGHTDKVSAGKTLEAEGVISGTGAAAVEVVASADNGFTWGVSMGAHFSKMDFVAAGKSVSVNGRSIPGPVYVARNGRLRELSFLTLAADDDTAASIAAEAAEQGEVMDFATWLKANGFQPEDKLSPSRLIVLRAQFKACGGKKLEDASLVTLKATVDAIEEPAATVNAGAGDDTVTGGNGADVTELKAQFARLERRQHVATICGEKHTTIAAKAIEKNWDDDTIKLAIKAADLESSAPKSFQVNAGRAADAPEAGIVLEAACAIAGGLTNLDKKYDQKALNEAHTQFRHGISLQELLLAGAQANGYTGTRVRGNEREVLEYGFRVQGAQFSTVSLPGIFSNVANKFLLESFMFVEQVWRELVAGVRSVNDFKTITSYRLTGDATYEEIGPGGEIPHGTVGEESFTNRVRSYGKMYGITFQDIRNDDLGALTGAPKKLGRGSGLKLNSVFWATFLANTTFFADPSQNYLKGAGTALGPDGLTAALLKFRQKTDPDGDPLVVNPRILLVPPALEVVATQLMQSPTFGVGGSSSTAQVPTTNIWAGRFRPLTSQYMLNETATTYYLLADPNDVPTMEVAALDGKIEPTVETADADFNTLGVLMRGHSHWGVAQQDARGGLKVKGAA